MKMSERMCAILCALACTATANAQWFTNGNKLYYNNGKVGIGTANPNSPLTVTSAIPSANHPTLQVKMTNPNPQPFSSAIRGISRGIGVNGIGIWGSHDGDGWGMYGTAVAGSGILGHVTGQGIAVRGVCDNANGYSCYFEGGRNYLEGLTGIGTTSPTTALHVVSSTTTGIFSSVTGANLIGIEGRCSGSNGRAIYGYASSVAGTPAAIVGDCESLLGFNFLAAGLGINYGVLSSQRWKSNIRPIDDPLEKLAQLRGVYFDWDEEHGGHHDIGFIAEEVGKVVPEIVSYEENGIDANGLDYGAMTPLLVEALKALRAEKDSEIAELREETNAEIANLRALIGAMQMEIESLKSSQAVGRGQK